MIVDLSQLQFDMLHAIADGPIRRSALRKPTLAALLRYRFVVDKDGTVYVTDEGKKWLDALSGAKEKT